MSPMGSLKLSNLPRAWQSWLRFSTLITYSKAIYCAALAHHRFHPCTKFFKVETQRRTKLSSKTGTPNIAGHSAKFAVNYGNDKDHKYRDNRNGNQPICSHPRRPSWLAEFAVARAHGFTLPTSHAPQRLHTPVYVAFALKERVSSVGNHLTLPTQRTKSLGADGLGLAGELLRGLEALRAAV
jgi:hypothetical protein